MNSNAQPIEYGVEFASLRSNGIHLWVTPYLDSRLDGFLPCFRALLTDQERAQEQKFHFQNDRRCFLITRALLRTTLSRYAGVRAQEWRFEADAYGKPGIAHDAPLIRRLQFNVSHAGGLVVLAVSLDRAVGVDTEHTGRAVASLELATRYFTSREADDIASVARLVRTRRFFEYWTLKEAYIKARGKGLSIALNQFDFQFHQSGVVDMSFQALSDDSASNWHLWQWSFPTGHLIALCAQSDPARTRPQIKCRRILPFVAEDPLSLEILRSSR